MTTHVPDGTPAEAVDDVRGREAAHTRELAAQGHVLRLWRPPRAPGEWRTIGLFAAEDDAELERVLASMPLRVWRSDDVKALTNHPNDPAPGAWPSPPASALSVLHRPDHEANAASERPGRARQQRIDRSRPCLTMTLL
jgi:muconolactone D-isomerase